MLSSARRRTLAVAVAAGAAAAAQLVATPAALAANPAQVCAGLGDLGLSRGACASSVATSGGTTEQTIAPSGAAFIANCKDLEATFFVADGDGPYPYDFYGSPALRADNRADCVTILRGLHSGEITPAP